MRNTATKTVSKPLLIAITFLIASSFVTFANAAKKPAAAKASVKKVASTPTPTPAPAADDATESKGDGAIPEDAAEDAVDKPIPRAKIESRDVPADIVAEVLAPSEGEAVPAPKLSSTPATVPAAAAAAPAGASASPSVPASISTGPATVTDTAPAAEEASEIKSASAGSDSQAVSAPTAPSETQSPAATSAAAPSANAAVVNPTTAEQSLKWLANGNTRFVSKAFRGDGRSAEDRIRSSKDQKPHAIVLACSESITPPELVFDQGIGEITTIRVAGPAVDSLVLKSLEEAVRNFDTHLILVLGHTQCSSLEGSPYIGRKHLDPGSKNEVEAALNADGIARSLAEKSVYLKSRIDAGQLSVKSALYWVDTGKVKFY